MIEFVVGWLQNLHGYVLIGAFIAFVQRQNSGQSVFQVAKTGSIWSVLVNFFVNQVLAVLLGPLMFEPTGERGAVFCGYMVVIILADADRFKKMAEKATNGS